MIHIVDPRQHRLFDPFEGVIPPAGQRIISSGWQATSITDRSSYGIDVFV